MKKKINKEFWSFPLYKKNADGSENGAEILGYKESVRWYRSALAIEAAQKLPVKETNESN